MIKKRYDVIIVGAGVAGLMLAKLMNNSKLDVLLVERRPVLKTFQNNHQYGTFKETIKKFKLEKYVFKKYKKFGFHTPNAKANFNYPKYEFQLVEMNKFVKDLNIKCDVKTKYTVTSVKRKNGCVEISNKGKDKYEAKIIVDCSGHVKIVAKNLGVKDDTINMFDRAYLLENCNIPYSDRWLYITDVKYANVGFWYYPFSKTKGIFAHTDNTSKRFPLLKNQRKSIDYFIRDIEPYKSWFKNARIVEEINKIGPATTELPFIVQDNILLCGDASGGGTPLVGEGFRIALEMANSAKETISYAFSKNDFTKKTLKIHETNFRKMFGKYYLGSYALRYLMLRFWTNDEYDLFAQNLRNMGEKIFLKAFRSEITFRIFLKCLSFKLLSKTFVNSIKYILSGFQPLNERVLN
jgi:flavin-dependent dehydrogenase